MNLSIRENANHSFYFAMINYEASITPNETGKQYDDGVVYEQIGKSIKFEIHGYHLPPNKYLRKISLQLLFQSFELFLKDCIINKLGEDSIWIGNNKSINLATSIRLYNSFSKYLLDKDTLLNYKNQRNNFEHYKLQTNIDSIDKIIRYLTAEIWILFQAEYDENMITFFAWDKWKETDVSFRDSFVTLLSSSQRIADFLEILFPTNDKYFCPMCGYQSVQEENMVCLVCNETADILV